MPRPNLAKISDLSLLPPQSPALEIPFWFTLAVMLSLCRIGQVARRPAHNELVRCFSALGPRLEKPLPPRTVIPESDITESFLKGSGPGGQKINKTSSAVQLKHLPTGIVVKSQETRSREQNRRNARRILGEKLEDLEKGAQSRRALKAEKASKKKASAAKKSQRKYRRLEQVKAAEKNEGAGAGAGAVTGAGDEQAGVEESADDFYSASQTSVK